MRHWRLRRRGGGMTSVPMHEVKQRTIFPRAVTRRGDRGQGMTGEQSEQRHREVAPPGFSKRGVDQRHEQAWIVVVDGEMRQKDFAEMPPRTRQPRGAEKRRHEVDCRTELAPQAGVASHRGLLETLLVPQRDACRDFSPAADDDEIRGVEISARGETGGGPFWRKLQVLVAAPQMRRDRRQVVFGRNSATEIGPETERRPDRQCRKFLQRLAPRMRSAIWFSAAIAVSAYGSAKGSRSRLRTARKPPLRMAIRCRCFLATRSPPR
jgi:hypothetical protein